MEPKLVTGNRYGIGTAITTTTGTSPQH